MARERVSTAVTSSTVEWRGIDGAAVLVDCPAAGGTHLRARRRIVEQTADHLRELRRVVHDLHRALLDEQLRDIG